MEGNEGIKCNYPSRLDTYMCGCQHDCSYCYAKYLLNFRKLWFPDNPEIADKNSIRDEVKKIDKEKVKAVRIGGMTDCFMPLEKTAKVTYELIKALNDQRIPYLIVTKGALIAEDEYIEILDKELAHIQITLTCTDDDLYRRLNYEKASLPSDRIKAIEKLQNLGYDVQLRLSPFIPEFIDFEKLNSIKVDKCLVEFLRVNGRIKRKFKIDYFGFTVKQGGYRHYPIEIKHQLVKKLKFKEVSVCEDETRAYYFWKNHFNPNPNDCCNLRIDNKNSKEGEEK